MKSMVAKRVWYTEDGKGFEDKKAALVHEAKLGIARLINDGVIRGEFEPADEEVAQATADLICRNMVREPDNWVDALNLLRRRVKAARGEGNENEATVTK